MCVGQKRGVKDGVCKASDSEHEIVTTNKEDFMGEMSSNYKIWS